MQIKKLKWCLPVLIALVLALVSVPLLAMAVDVTGVDGVAVTVDSNGSISESSGSVTVTVSGSLASAKTATVTVENTLGSTATVSFDYSATKVSACSLGSVSNNSCSGTKTETLAAGGKITFTITTRTWSPGNTTATIVLSNFKVEAAAASSDVTVNYDTTLGSVTVDGAAAASGSVHNISSATGASLVATPKSSNDLFLGWIDSSNKIVCADATYPIIPTEDTVVTAVFAGNSTTATAWFGVGKATSQSYKEGTFDTEQRYVNVTDFTHLYNNLNDAAAVAESSTSKYVVLMNSGAISGNHTIPTGVTLLIPYNSDNSLFTTEPLKMMTYSTPTVYRKLTMNSGASITVNGAMSLSAQVSYTTAKDNEGSPYGPVSFVDMKSNSSISVGNGGALYAWGFITGSGSVTANNGASVYECFQIMDYRGGGQSTESDMSNNGIFPISQYYVQNIEVPLTLNYGAKEYAYAVICAKPLLDYYDYPSTVSFIGTSGSMFNLAEGCSVTKKYDGSTDRLIVEVNGSLSLSSISLQIDTSTSINSSSYELPINGNMTIKINSGNSTIGQDLALLPGSEIIIAQGANVTLGNGVSVYTYDADQWGEFVYTENYNGPLHIYDGSDTKNASWNNVAIRALEYAPGRASGVDREAAVAAQGQADAAICVNGTLDASAGYLYTTTKNSWYTHVSKGETVYPATQTTDGANIYSTASGVVMINPGTQAATYQVLQDEDDTTGSDEDYYVTIPITPAKLLNAYTNDGELTTYTETSAAAGTYVYNATHGRWDLAVNEMSHTVSSAVTAPTCTEKGYTTYTCTCGYTYTADEVAANGHSFTDGVCTVCGWSLFKMEAANVVLGNNLDMCFAFSYNGNDNLTDASGYYVKLMRTYANGKIDTVTYPVGGWTTNNGYYVVTYGNLAAKEMCDEITLAVYDGSGNQVSNTWSDSMQSYAMRQIEKYEKKEASTEKDLILTVLVDMLNYGAAAQHRFSYNTTDLANSLLSDTQKGYATTEVTKTTAESVLSDQWKASNLVTTSNIQFLLAFRGIQDGMYATVTFKDHYGETQDSTIDSFKPSGSFRYLTIGTLVVADAWQQVTVTIYNADGTEYTACTDSIAGYLSRYEEHNEIDAAYLKFAQAAWNYFRYLDEANAT